MNKGKWDEKYFSGIFKQKSCLLEDTYQLKAKLESHKMRHGKQAGEDGAEAVWHHPWMSPRSSPVETSC